MILGQSKAFSSHHRCLKTEGMSTALLVDVNAASVRHKPARRVLVSKPRTKNP